MAGLPHELARGMRSLRLLSITEWRGETGLEWFQEGSWKLTEPEWISWPWCQTSRFVFFLLVSTNPTSMQPHRDYHRCNQYPWLLPDSACFLRHTSFVLVCHSWHFTAVQIAKKVSFIEAEEEQLFGICVLHQPVYIERERDTGIPYRKYVLYIYIYQHLAVSVNSLDSSAWNDSFGTTMEGPVSSAFIYICTLHSLYYLYQR